MQIKKYRQKNKLFIGSTILIITALGLYVLAFRPFESSPTRDTEDRVAGVNYEKPTQGQVDAGYDAKKRSLESEAPSSPNTAPAVTITSLNQTNGTVTVRATVDTTTAGGNCTLEMTRESGKKVTRSADLQVYSSYSVCMGFDIPESELIKGDWKVAVTYTKAGKVSTASRDFEVN